MPRSFLDPEFDWLAARCDLVPPFGPSPRRAQGSRAAHHGEAAAALAPSSGSAGEVALRGIANERLCVHVRADRRFVERRRMDADEQRSDTLDIDTRLGARVTVAVMGLLAGVALAQSLDVGLRTLFSLF